MGVSIVVTVRFTASISCNLNLGKSKQSKMAAESEETIIPLQNVPTKNQTLKAMTQSADHQIQESLEGAEEGIAGEGRHQAPKTPTAGGPSPVASGSNKLPSWNAFKTLAVFLLFRVVLPACDVVTDFLTGFSLWQRGHIRWGVVTLVLVFCPFLAGLVKYFVKKMWPYYFEDPDARHGTKITEDAVWLLPLVQPFV